MLTASLDLTMIWAKFKKKKKTLSGRVEKIWVPFTFAFELVWLYFGVEGYDGLHKDGCEISRATGWLHQ